MAPIIQHESRISAPDAQQHARQKAHEFAAFASQGAFTDIRIVADEGEPVRCHSVIMHKMSAFWAAIIADHEQFYRGHELVVSVPGVAKEVVKAVVEIVYQGMYGRKEGRAVFTGGHKQVGRLYDAIQLLQIDGISCDLQSPHQAAAATQGSTFPKGIVLEAAARPPPPVDAPHSNNALRSDDEIVLSGDEDGNDDDDGVDSYRNEVGGCGGGLSQHNEGVGGGGVSANQRAVATPAAAGGSANQRSSAEFDCDDGGGGGVSQRNNGDVGGVGDSANPRSSAEFDYDDGESGGGGGGGDSHRNESDEEVESAAAAGADNAEESPEGAEESAAAADESKEDHVDESLNSTVDVSDNSIEHEEANEDVSETSDFVAGATHLENISEGPPQETRHSRRGRKRNKKSMPLKMKRAKNNKESKMSKNRTEIYDNSEDENMEEAENERELYVDNSKEENVDEKEKRKKELYVENNSEGVNMREQESERELYFENEADSEKFAHTDKNDTGEDEADDDMLEGTARIGTRLTTKNDEESDEPETLENVTADENRMELRSAANKTKNYMKKGCPKKNHGKPICLICGRNDLTLAKLREHYCLNHFASELLNNVNDGNKTVCSMCNKNFKHKSGVIRHLGIFHKKLLNFEQLEEVESQLFGNYNVKTLPRDYVEKYSKTDNGSTKTSTENTEDNNDKPEEQTYEAVLMMTCSKGECGFGATQNVKMRRHLSKHFEQQITEQFSDSNLETKFDSDNNVICICPICNVSIVRTKLFYHIGWAHEYMRNYIPGDLYDKVTMNGKKSSSNDKDEIEQSSESEVEPESEAKEAEDANVNTSQIFPIKLSF